jgi:hypothetical protein
MYLPLSSHSPQQMRLEGEGEGMVVRGVPGRPEGETVYPDSVKSCSRVAAPPALVVPSSVGAKVVLNREQTARLCVLVKELFQTVVVNSKK